jgi:hypothetical protein
MKKETYKGYELHINNIVHNPNGRDSQTVLIYKTGNPVGAAFADIQFEDAVKKAKSKVDNFSK